MPAHGPATALRSDADKFDTFRMPTETAPQLVDLIKEHGMRAAVAISPDTPADAITDDLGKKVDMILVMTVVPGTSGILTIPTVAAEQVASRQAKAGRNSCHPACPKSPLSALDSPTST